MPDRSIVELAPLQQQTAPLRGKIILALRNGIETGLLQPGQRLVERKLCAQLNVSRASLREALRELQADGILIQAGARGLAVGVIARRDAENAYSIRALVEALVVEQFIELATEREVEQFVDGAETLKAAYRSGDVELILLSKRAYYERICSVAGNAMAFDIINRLSLQTASLRNRSLASKARQRQGVKEVDAIAGAVAKRDRLAGGRAARAYVEGAARSALDLADALPVEQAPIRPRRRRSSGSGVVKH